MRRLAQELGVEAMSLYYHVANKEEILNGIVDMIVGEMSCPRPATSGRRQFAGPRSRRTRSSRAIRGRPASCCRLRGQPGPLAVHERDPGHLGRPASRRDDRSRLPRAGEPHHGLHALGGRHEPRHRRGPGRPADFSTSSRPKLPHLAEHVEQHLKPRRPERRGRVRVRAGPHPRRPREMRQPAVLGVQSLDRSKGERWPASCLCAPGCVSDVGSRALFSTAAPVRADTGLTGAIASSSSPRNTDAGLHEIAHQRVAELNACECLEHDRMRPGTAEVIGWNQGVANPVSNIVGQWIGVPRPQWDPGEPRVRANRLRRASRRAGLTGSRACWRTARCQRNRPRSRVAQGSAPLVALPDTAMPAVNARDGGSTERDRHRPM